MNQVDNVIKLSKGVSTMLKYASRTRLIIFTILSIIGFIILIASVVLSIIYNSFAYECGGAFIALTIPSIWTLLLEETEERRAKTNRQSNR